jgi:hypothetical protein
MMFKSATEELSQWADQCRRWAKGARTREQRLTLQSLERLLDDAAIEAELESSADAAPLAPRQRS